jgi:hypothetical protein
MIRSLNPSSRDCPLRTMRGSKLPARSRGTANSTGPTSVSSRFEVLPLREFPDPRPAGSCLS